MKLLEASEGTQTPKAESPKMSSNNSASATALIKKNQTQTNGSSMNNTVTSTNNNSVSCNNSMNTYMQKNRNSTRFEVTSGDETECLSSDEFEGECLEYSESPGEHPTFVLAGLNHLRKQGQFCDITLVVQDQEFPVHRAVLAACSQYMFDFLSCLEETTESQPTYKLKDVPHVGFRHLVDYMYTGRLLVPVGSVPVVYATALLLKMESASRACASFLSNHLTAANCLGIRRFTKDKAFKQSVDEYIRANLLEIMSSKSFFGLTNLQVEVVGLDESISDEAMERRLFSLVLDWAKNNLNDLKPKIERLTEKVNVLYLESDNTLRDCADMEDTVQSSDDDMVQDYKILARRRSKNSTKGGNSRMVVNGNGAQPFHKFSLNPEEAVSVAEREWSIVATRKTSENTYLAIAVLDGHLMAISVHIRPPMPQSADSNSSGSVPDSPPVTTGNKNRMSPVLRKATITPLEPMSTARCAMGAVALDGMLVVCGGYDRGECLQSVEAFNIKENIWMQMPPMNRARGRFSATVLDGCVYVCGGSDGWKELSCVEKYDPATKKWTYMAPMLKERSSHGVVTLNGKMYCVGGCEGQRSIATCEVYDPSTNRWSSIAPLKMARSQTCVCTYKGYLFAIGGTDLWNTLGTVEMYDPEKDEWVISSCLNIARRGAGVDIVQDIMVVVGGSDGAQSLLSSEFYDFDANVWSIGPALNSLRANLSMVTIGNRLFAVGGFSGKKFLSSLEWLDLDDKEWFGHAPRPDAANGGGNGSKDGQSEEVRKGAGGDGQKGDEGNAGEQGDGVMESGLYGGDDIGDRESGEVSS